RRLEADAERADDGIVREIVDAGRISSDPGNAKAQILVESERRSDRIVETGVIRARGEGFGSENPAGVAEMTREGQRRTRNAGLEVEINVEIIVSAERILLGRISSAQRGRDRTKRSPERSIQLQIVGVEIAIPTKGWVTTRPKRANQRVTVRRVRIKIVQRADIEGQAIGNIAAPAGIDIDFDRAIVADIIQADSASAVIELRHIVEAGETGAPSTNVETAIVSNIDTALNGEIAIGQRNTTESIVGHDCGVTGNGDSRSRILRHCGRGSEGGSSKNAGSQEAADGRKHG